MADVKQRVTGFPSTTETASDDYLLLDGATNGTRKILMTDVMDDTLTVEGKAADAKAVGQELAKKLDSADVPTKVSDLTNDAKYQTDIEVAAAVSGNVDATLAVTGKAADAKKTGDEITALKSDLNEIGTFEYFNLWDKSKEIPNSMCNNVNLIISSNSNYKLNKIKVEGGNTYSYKNGGRNSSKPPRFIVFVDSSGAGISKIDRTEMGDEPVFSTPQNAVEAWVTVDTSDTNAMIIRGEYYKNTYVEYFPHELTYKSMLTTYDITDYKTSGRNLVNEEAVTPTLLNGVQNLESDIYESTEYIPVKGGTLYSIGPNPRGARIINLYYTNKVLYKIINNPSNIYSFAPDADGFCRISFYKEDKGQYILVEGTDITYEPYRVVYAEDILLNDNQMKDVKSRLTIGNVLADKKWAVLGDSFTQGATGTRISEGRYKTRPYTYPYLIGNRNNMDIISFFGGGRTLAFPENPDTFVNSVTCPTQAFYYQNIPEDADYITIYLGINDSHHEHGTGGDGEDPTGIIPIGTIEDNTTATYYGAWNVVLTWLTANRPFAHIGMIVSNGCDRDAYRSAQLEIAEKYGIPYIDLNGDSRTPTMIRSRNPNIATAVKTAINQKQAVDYDGSKTGTVNMHPNDEAHLYESYFIENFLRSI